MTTDGVAGVVFDLDGVLVETEQLWERSWGTAADRRGYRWTRSDTTHAQGMSAPEWSAYLAERAGVPDQAGAILAECVEEMVVAIRAGAGPLLDGAAELVRQVGTRVPIALASSAARAVIDTVLDEHTLTDHFVATVSSEEVARGKPRPDVYLEAARRLGLPVGPRANGAESTAATTATTATTATRAADAVPAGHGLAVEDSANGIRAAHAAGFSVVALPNPTYPPAPEALELADYVAANHQAATAYVVGILDGSAGPVNDRSRGRANVRRV